jgi:hypothetical protein
VSDSTGRYPKIPYWKLNAFLDPTCSPVSSATDYSKLIYADFLVIRAELLVDSMRRLSEGESL